MAFSMIQSDIVSQKEITSTMEMQAAFKEGRRKNNRRDLERVTSKEIWAVSSKIWNNWMQSACKSYSILSHPWSSSSCTNSICGRASQWESVPWTSQWEFLKQESLRLYSTGLWVENKHQWLTIDIMSYWQIPWQSVKDILWHCSDRW